MLLPAIKTTSYYVPSSLFLSLGNMFEVEIKYMQRVVVNAEL